MTALADDLRDYVAVPTPIEDIPAGAEVDLGTGWLVQVTDTDTAAEREHGDHGDLVHVVILHYEDHAGAPATFTRPRGTEVDQYVRVPRAEGLSEVDRVAIARSVVDAPPLTRAQVELLSRSLGQLVRDEISKRGEAAA